MPSGRLIGGYPSSTIKGMRSDGSVAFEWRWNDKHYEKMLGTMRVTASAVVVLFTYAPYYYGRFPGGPFSSDVDTAIACGEGRAVEVTWCHTYNLPLVLEYPKVYGKGNFVHLPRARISFGIVSYDQYDCSYGE